MSNKVDTAMTTLTNALIPLGTAGVFKSIRRGVINPLAETTIASPVLALAVSRMHRESGSFWVVEVLIQIAAAQKASLADGAIAELVAAVDGAIETLSAGSSAGGVLDQPTWDFWYVHAGSGLVPVGALGALRMQLESPLKT